MRKICSNNWWDGYLDVIHWVYWFNSRLTQFLESAFGGAEKMLTGNFHEIPGHFLWLLKNSSVIFSKKISATIKTSFDFCFGRRWVVLWLDAVVNPAFIMMKFVRAAREVDWPLHLVALKAMLPYFAAAGH